MKKLILCAMGTILLMSLLVGHAQDSVPDIINYQGILIDAGTSAPITPGVYTVEFRICDAPQHGNLIWGRSFPLNVSSGGVFNVLLNNGGGELRPAPQTNYIREAFQEANRYLGLTVSPGTQKIQPRQKIASATYAMNAVGGSKVARAGLRKIAEAMGDSTDWRMVHRRYRKWMITAGEEKGMKEDGNAAQPGFSRDDIARVWEERGELKRAELLRCRVRYFTDGVAIGGRGFVQELFESCRDRFGENRERGGSRMRGSGFGKLYSIRNLQVDVVS